MNAFTVAREILGGMALSAEQLVQLRAINHEHAQRLHALLRSSGAADRHDHAAGPPGSPRTAQDLTAAEVAELHGALVADVRGLLTPEQRRLLGET